jgi:NAD(P)H dehydrogenase (quinone)
MANDDSIRRILVTGATGMVGGSVVRALKEAGFNGEIFCGTRRPESFEPPDSGGTTPVRLDFADQQSVRDSVRNMDAVFLVTGYTVDMLVQSKALLDAAKAAAVRHIVHLGALAPMDTILPPPSWHQYVERYIEALGFSYTHVRPNFFMDTIIEGVKRAKGRLYHFFGDAPLSCVSVSDIAEVAAAALLAPGRHAGKVYDLAGEAMTMSQVAEVLAAEWKQEVRCMPRPSEEFLPILLKTGMEPAYAAGLAAQVAAIAGGALPTASVVSTATEEVLNRPARTWRDAAKASH